MPSALAILAIGLAVKRGTKPSPKKLEIRIEPGIDFEATYVVYHVTVRNRGDIVNLEARINSVPKAVD